MSNTKQVLLWQIGGALCLIFVGSLLHFVYRWSGFSPIVGIFSAVNESVWEHLKLGFWSLVFYSAAEFPFIRGKTNNYFLAKSCGILSLQVLLSCSSTFTPPLQEVKFCCSMSYHT